MTKEQWVVRALDVLGKARRAGLDASALRLMADGVDDLNLPETAEALRLFARLIEHPLPAR